MSNLIYSETQRAFWTKRFSERPEDELQTTKINSILRSVLSPTRTYRSALDLGCGNGRFVPLLASVCQHVWAVDIVPEVELHVTARGRNVTAWIVEDDNDGLPSGPHDFLFASFLFQHIVEDAVFKGLTVELQKVLQPGARVLILDNAKDVAKHIRARDPGLVAKALGLSSWESKLASVNNRPQDHWLLEGVK